MRQTSYRAERLIAKPGNSACRQKRYQDGFDRTLRGTEHDKRPQRRRQRAPQRGEILGWPILLCAAAAGEEQRDVGLIKTEPGERLPRLSDIAGEHVDMWVWLCVWRRAALAEFVQVAGGDVAPSRGTEGMEADCSRRGGRFD